MREPAEPHKREKLYQKHWLPVKQSALKTSVSPEHRSRIGRRNSAHRLPLFTASSSTPFHISFPCGSDDKCPGIVVQPEAGKPCVRLIKVRKGQLHGGVTIVEECRRVAWPWSSTRTALGVGLREDFHARLLLQLEIIFHGHLGQKIWIFAAEASKKNCGCPPPRRCGQPMSPLPKSSLRSAVRFLYNRPVTIGLPNRRSLCRNPHMQNGKVSTFRNRPAEYFFVLPRLHIKNNQCSACPSSFNQKLQPNFMLEFWARKT